MEWVATMWFCHALAKTCGFVTHCKDAMAAKDGGFLTHCKDAMGGVAMCCHQLDMRVGYVWMCKGKGKL